MPAFEAEVGLPYWIDLTTAEPRKSTVFYERLLGWETHSTAAAADESDTADAPAYTVARIQGLPIAGFIPQPAQSPQPDTWLTHFLSTDILGDCQRAQDLGGRVLAQPQPVELGTMALLADPAGAIFGLIEPTGVRQFVAAGEPGCPVWHELSATTSYEQAREFYGELFNWEIRGDDSYALAEEEGAAFAGIRNAHGQFPPQVPSFWQTFLGVEDIDAAVSATADLGGEVLRAAEDSPFGRLAVIADPTGAVVTLCEVEPAPEEDPRESDDLLDLGN